MFTDLKIPAGRRPLTRGEARASAILVSVFTLLILAAILEEYSPKKLSILLILLFWIPMLFVHELGHALAAKLLNWRVREIVIGFGRDLWQFQIGDTRVKIKLLPVEGYVLPAPKTPSAIRLKSMLIYAAGPGAELIVLAVLLLVFGWDTVFNDSSDVSLIALKSLAIVIIYGAGFNLLPFRVEGAVSDGLGIISSPFISDESIELRLLTVELRDLHSALVTGASGRALQSAAELLQRFPHNTHLRALYGSALAADGQDDAARNYVRKMLGEPKLPDSQRRTWLHLQAKIELDAAVPDFLTLDLALQKAFAITPRAPDLLATKGASLVLRGHTEDGGNMLADAWRRNDGSADDATMLAYLTVAAQRVNDGEAHRHFSHAFRQVNRSVTLEKRVNELGAVNSPARHR